MERNHALWPTSYRALLATVTAAVGLGAAAAQAQIQHLAQGRDLAGATLTIQWRNIANLEETVTESATILPNGAGAIAFVNNTHVSGGGFALFRVAPGLDTWFDAWEIQNNSVGLWAIEIATFDLRGSISLFDNNAGPSTPNSFLGRAVPLPLPATAPSFDTALKFDVAIAPDMHYQQSIKWGRQTFNSFLPGQYYAWQDDTDLIPTPGSLALLAFAGTLAARRRRR